MWDKKKQTHKQHQNNPYRIDDVNKYWEPVCWLDQRMLGGIQVASIQSAIPADFVPGAMPYIDDLGPTPPTVRSP